MKYTPFKYIGAGLSALFVSAQNLTETIELLRKKPEKTIQQPTTNQKLKGKS
ncbi:hypothetical protein GCM10011450_08360 [Advenella faeciporci]|uniref:Uncharacterized protein n=1 Tax=Advenella faeciporci TaxID=797535 RepID=A0A918MWY9_9BURK|nr:hypothetical protein GCM10011450_08360 [Advenella faeciporci]